MKTNMDLLQLNGSFFSGNTIPAEVAVIYPDILYNFEPHIFLVVHKILRVFVDIVNGYKPFISGGNSQNFALGRHDGIFICTPYCNGINSAVFYNLISHCVIL